MYSGDDGTQEGRWYAEGFKGEQVSLQDGPCTLWSSFCKTDQRTMILRAWCLSEKAHELISAILSTFVQVRHAQYAI